MDDVPHAHAIDEALDGTARVGASEDSDKTREDRGVSWCPMVFFDVLEVAEQVEGKEARAIGASCAGGVRLFQDAADPEQVFLPEVCGVTCLVQCVSRVLRFPDAKPLVCITEWA